MKTTLVLLGLLLLAGCGSETAQPTPTPAAATSPPVASGAAVTTRGAVTVLDDGDGAELCLGAVRTSLPPQCGGPRLVGWDWSEHPGDFEQSRGVRWGGFKVSGTFADGAVTPTEVVALADLDEEPSYGGRREPGSRTRHTDAELARIQEAMQELPGMLTSDRGDDRVDVTVTYDDGTLQEALDKEYGEGTVWVDSALVPVGAPPTPAATGPVHTAGLVTVMDTGTPEVCLGPVAESYPPQCRGPELVGWDWADRRGMFEKQGDVRWGQFALAGTWDGERLAVESAVPAGSYDSTPPPSLAVPTPAVKHGPTELASIADAVASIPGAAGSGYVRGHNVIVSVVYDDGSLQDWANGTYGDGVVFVVSMLVG